MNKASLSIQNFKKDTDEVFNNIIAIDHFEFLYFMQSQRVVSKRKTEYIDSYLNKPLKRFEEKNYMNNLFLAFIISTMETYLQNRLVEEIENFPNKVELLLKEYKWNRKYTAEDILNGPKVLANEILNSIIYHRLEKVNILYKILLGFDIIELMSDSRIIWHSIKIRHKVNHQAGKIGKNKIDVSSEGLFKSLNSISSWIENIDFYYRNGKLKNNSRNFYTRYEKNESQLHKLYPEEKSLFNAVKMSRSRFFNPEYEKGFVKTL